MLRLLLLHIHGSISVKFSNFSRLLTNERIADDNHYRVHLHYLPDTWTKYGQLNTSVRLIYHFDDNTAIFCTFWSTSSTLSFLNFTHLLYSLILRCLFHFSNFSLSLVKSNSSLKKIHRYFSSHCILISYFSRVLSPVLNLNYFLSMKTVMKTP